MLGKDGKDLGAVAKFAALVHDAVLVVVHDAVLFGDVGRIASKPAIEPFDGGLLGTTSCTLDLATVVVGDGDIANFAIEAGVLFKTLGVLGGLNNKTEINAKSLKASSRFARVLFAASGFSELDSEAEGTVVDLGGDRKLWDALDELVGFGETSGVTVGKSLMPENTLGVTRQVMNTEDVIGMGVGKEVSFDRIMRGRCMHL